MTQYYDVVLISKEHNRKTHYTADSFSVNDDRILKIYSKEFGDVVVQIRYDEELTVNEIELRDEYDEELRDEYDEELIKGNTLKKGIILRDLIRIIPPDTKILLLDSFDHGIITARTGFNYMYGIFPDYKQQYDERYVDKVKVGENKTLIIYVRDEK